MLHVRFIFPLLFAVALFGSALGEDSNRESDPFKGFSDVFRVFPDSEGRTYFPEGRERYYTHYLAAMKEPSVMPHPNSDDAFILRFSWFRSFHDPVAVRIWRNGAEYKIRAIRLAKQKDYTVGPVTKDTTRALTKEELTEIQRLTRDNDIWKPFNEQEELAMWGGEDGSRWIFERVKQQDYAMIDLYSPKDMGIEQYKKAGRDVSQIRDFKPFVRLGLYLLRITKLTPPNDDDIY